MLPVILLAPSLQSEALSSKAGLIAAALMMGAVLFLALRAGR